MLKIVFIWVLLLGGSVGAKTYKLSVGPALAYTPTYGIILGGTVFRNTTESAGWDLGGFAVSSLKPNFIVDSYCRYHFSPSLRFFSSFFISNFFTPDYGEGDSTLISSRRDIGTNRTEVRLGPESTFADDWAIWPHLDFRHRNNTEPSALPEGGNATLGLQLKWQKSGEGMLRQIHTLLVRASPSFGQGEVDLRFYLGEQNLQLASRLFQGYSLGAVPYLFAYSFGGRNLLRGFYENRFREVKATLVQQEFRFPIYSRVSGAIFTDIGDVYRDRPTNILISYGGGFRVALPPDYVAKVRLDYGMTRDQKGVFFSYGESF